MEKRKKFIITSIVLSLGFIGINLLENYLRFWAIGGLTIATIILFFWSLAEGLGLNATLLTLILPGLFTLGVGLFWFLLPTTILARLPIIILYGLGIYALNLTLNIFTVSAVRTIALARAAKGVGFVLTLLVAFLLFDTILSVKFSLWLTVLMVALVSFLLFFQGLWVIRLEKNLFSGDLLLISGLLSLGLAEIAMLLYFWPVTVVVGSLFLTVAVYILLGLGQASREGRLFKHTVREYLTVGLVVFIAMLFFATYWGG